MDEEEHREVGNNGQQEIRKRKRRKAGGRGGILRRKQSWKTMKRHKREKDGGRRRGRGGSMEGKNRIGMKKRRRWIGRWKINVEEENRNVRKTGEEKNRCHGRVVAGGQ